MTDIKADWRDIGQTGGVPVPGDSQMSAAEYNAHAAQTNANTDDLTGKLDTPTGTPDGTKYARDDGTWAVPPGGGGGGTPTDGSVTFPKLAPAAVVTASETIAANLNDTTIPTSAAVQAAITAAVTALLNGAPGALDTLKELADAINDDASFAASITTALAGKQPLDSDLTAIAALTTTTFGRSLLTQPDGAATRNVIGAGTASVVNYSSGWPARPSTSSPVIWVGGDAIANPPTASVNGDLWLPATGDGDATKEAVLTPTAVQSAAYPAVRGDLIPVDTTSGAVPITLPTAPADKTRIAVKVIAGTAGTNGQLVNNATIAPGGSDVFNKSGGSTLLTLSMLNQGVVLQYGASGAIWYVVSTDVPLTALDARYQPLTSNLALTTGPFPTDQLTAGFLSVPRWTVSANALALLTGVMQLTYVTCDKTQTVTGVTLRCGATAAAATPTLCRIGLYSVAANGDLTLIASTPNDTTLFAAANTSYTKAFSASVGVTLGVRYAIGTLVVSGTTLPSMCGPSTSNLGSAELAIAPRRTGQISSLSDLPSTATAASVANNSSLLYARVA